MTRFAGPGSTIDSLSDPQGRSARARPPGRAQRGTGPRRASEVDVELSHGRAAAGGLDPTELNSATSEDPQRTRGCVAPADA